MSASAPGQEQGRRTLDRLERIRDIPTLPAVLVKVWEITADRSASAGQLAATLQKDPGLTGSVLRLANSAYLGFPGRVATVTQGVVVLGFETVRNLATGACAFRALSRNGAPMDTDGFFRHSLAAALGARLALSRRGAHRAGSAFCAGILHDLGKLVTAEFLPEEWKRLHGRLDEGADDEAAELEELGMSHAEIGEWFARRWSLPPELKAAIRWHHAVDPAGPHAHCVAAVHVGDVAAHRAGAGGSGRRVAPVPSGPALEVLGLDEDGLDDITGRVEAALTDGAAIALGAR